MDFFANLLPLELVESLVTTQYAWFIVPLAVSALMAVAIVSSLPGVLTPVSLLGGALLGFPAIFFLSLGAVIGSHLLFVASRYWLGGYMHRRFGQQIERHQHHLATRGPLYIAGLRLGGMPHVLLTASCAAAPISHTTFAAAILLGLLPGITIATLAGHAIF